MSTSTRQPALPTSPTASRRTPPAPTLPIAFTYVLAAVVVVAALFGLFVDGAYRAPAGVRPTLPATLQGQDMVNLLAAGALVWGGRRARTGSLVAHVVWLAICLYLPYTYLMYVMAPYNDVLLLYIAGIGLAGFGLFHGLVRLEAEPTARAFADLPRRPLAWYLLGLAALFATMWLADILSVWPGGIPTTLFTYDLPSIVHVLDLGVVLPLVAATGVLLLRRHPIAPVLAVLLLVKTLTLGLALLSMNAVVAATGGTIDPTEPVIWTVVTLVSVAWLTVVLRRVRPTDGPWLRPTIW